MGGIQIEINDAWERHQRIVGYRTLAEKTFLDLGKELYWFEEKKQYLQLDHPTFESYLADPTVDISRRTAYKLKGIYERYCLELKVPSVALLPAGYSKLDDVRPYVDEDNVSEWVAKASALSRSDLKREINENSSNSRSAPQWLFDLLDSEFHFDMQASDLSDLWRGVCLMVPPRGSIYDWVQAAYQAALNGATVVCLVPVRTDARWWWDYCVEGEVRFLRDRNAVVIFRPGVRESSIAWWRVAHEV